MNNKMIICSVIVLCLLIPAVSADNVFTDTHSYVQEVYFDNVNNLVNFYNYNLNNINNLIATGNITGENVFIKSDIFLHTDDSSNVAIAGKWYNVTFTHNTNIIVQGINHTYNDVTNDTIIPTYTGVYDLKFAGNFNDTSVNPSEYAYMRIIVNGVEVHGSGAYSYISKQYAHVIVNGCARIEITAGDEVKLQFTGTSTNTNLEAQSGYFDHVDSARLCLVRIR
jgi:hypothetical protein